MVKRMKTEEKNIAYFTAEKDLRESLNKAERAIGQFELYNALIRRATEIKSRVRPHVAMSA